MVVEMVVMVVVVIVMIVIVMVMVLVVLEVMVMMMMMMMMMILRPMTVWSRPCSCLQCAAWICCLCQSGWLSTSSSVLAETAT